MPLRLRRDPSRVSIAIPVVTDTRTKTSDCDVKLFDGKYEFENMKHAQGVLATLDRLRKQGVFTDVILATTSQEFPCHRAVLASGSKYFEAMFCNDHCESREMMVKIKGMNDDIMAILLDYLYTSRVSITSDNAQHLLEASSLFQIDEIRDICGKFLKAQLDPCNCIGMKEFAERHALTSLFNKSSEMMNEKFSDVVMYEEFLELSKTRLIEYISDDDINVSHEEFVYEAVKRWVAHDYVMRAADFPQLLHCIRLPLIRPTYFVNIIERDEQVTCNPACQNLLQETRKYHILGNEINSERTRPRRSTGCKAVIVIVGGADRVGGYSTPNMNAFDPVTGKWESLAKLPTFTKSEYAVTSFRNNIIVSGGRIHSRDVWLYQSHINNWVKIAFLCKGRWRHRMIALGGHVYCLGGYDGRNKLVSVEQYDSFYNSWQEVSPLLFPVSICALASCHGKLYVIGADDVKTPCKIQVYSPESDAWSVHSAMPTPQQFISAATLNGKIYVLGGSDSSMSCYDPLTNSWESRSTSLFEDRLKHCGLTVCGGKLYIAGGKGDGNEASEVIYSYDPESKQMKHETVMLRPSCFHGCVTIHRFKSNV